MIGFETYVDGTPDVQLTTDMIHIRFSEKIVLNNLAWNNTNFGYSWVDTVINHSVKQVENPILVIKPTQYPCKLFYKVIYSKDNQFRVTIESTLKAPIECFIYSTRAPLPNPSKTGLELYKDGLLVFASETPVLTPIDITGLNSVSDLGAVVGIICNKQSWTDSHSWEQEDANEYWHDSVVTYGSAEFVHERKVRVSMIAERESWISNSGPSGSGESYSASDYHNMVVIDVTGV